MVTYIKFYEAIDEMKKNLKKEQPISDKIMEKAKKNIFNNKQKRILNEIKKIYKK